MPEKSQQNYDKGEKVELILPYGKMYYKTIIIKIMWGIYKA